MDEGVYRLRKCRFELLVPLVAGNENFAIRAVTGKPPCMAGRPTKKRICVTPVNKGYARKIKTTCFARG